MKGNLSETNINTTFQELKIKNDILRRTNSNIFNRKIIGFFPKKKNNNNSFKNIQIASIKKILDSRKERAKSAYHIDDNLKNNDSIENKNIKDKFIEKLKNNFSYEEKKRKKMLYVNVNVNLNQNYSMLNKYNENNDLLNKEKDRNTLFENKNNIEKEPQMRLFTDPNLLINKKINPLHNYLNNLNMKNNNIKKEKLPTMISNKVIIKNDINNKINIDAFQLLENKMEKLYKENIINSKTRKYNIIKIIFEEGIKLFNNNEQNFLKIILSKYHNLYSEMFKENKTLKQNYETLKNQNLKIDKNYIQTISLLKEKEKELEKIKTEIQALKFCNEKNNNINRNKNNINIIFSKSVDNILVNQHNKYLDLLNKSNIEDLDALYFKDKIDINKTQNSKKNKDKIPKLNFEPVYDFLNVSKKINENHKNLKLKKDINIINDINKIIKKKNK